MLRPFRSRTMLAISDGRPEVLDKVVALVLFDEALVDRDGRRLLLLEPVYVVRGRSTTARAVLSESMLSDEEM